MTLKWLPAMAFCLVAAHVSADEPSPLKGPKEKLSYGIGADLSSVEWDNIFRQLIHLGYLVQDFSRFGALGLSPAARPVLKGETKVTLGLPRDVAKVEEKTRRRSGAGGRPGGSGRDAPRPGNLAQPAARAQATGTRTRRSACASASRTRPGVTCHPT